MRIILDFVINHTSDQHKWFIDSKSSRTAAAPRLVHLARWQRTGPSAEQLELQLSADSAWKFDPTTNQYYYHYFYAEQPDLNWRNPAVEKAMFDVTRWWYKRGVSGFRLDAVDTLFEDPDLRDNPFLPGTNKYGDPDHGGQIQRRSCPKFTMCCKALRKVADEHGAVLIGETWTNDISELKKYYGEHSNELQMPMDLMFGMVNKLSAPEFRRQIAAVDCGWRVARVRHQQP